MSQKLLLSAFLLVFHEAALAQSVVFTHRQPAHSETLYLPRSESPTTEAGSAEKTATGNTRRWYSYFETLDTFVLNMQLSANLRSVPLWQDSTIRQRYVDPPVYRAINYSSLYQIMGPSYLILYNYPLFYPGALYILPIDTFSVDSIFIAAVYQRLPSKAAVVDTLLLSVTHLASAGNFSSYPLLTVTSVDSVRRTAHVGAGTANPGVVWKVPLYYADSAINGKFFRFRVGGPAGTALKVTPGHCVAITATFRSGDTWVRNADSFNAHNNWRPITGSTGNNAQMPYHWFTYDSRDESGLMFSKDSSHYYPSYFIEANNTPAFSYEFHYMGMKTGCSSCQNVGINERRLLTAGQPWPKPADRQLAIPYRLAKSSQLEWELYDLSGRLLQAGAGPRAAGEGREIVRTEDLAAGSYVYLLKAGREQLSGLFCVQH